MIFFNCPFVYFGVGYCQVSLFLLFVLGASPFDSFQVADVGDVNLNLYNLPKACEDIRKHFLKIIQTWCIPLALGGDHTMTYPILQAIKVHGSTNNTDRMYTLSFSWRPHYDLSYTPGY
jgi:arginase family enzyme